MKNRMTGIRNSLIVSVLVLSSCAQGSKTKGSVSFTMGNHVLEYGTDLWEGDETVPEGIRKFISSHQGELSVDDSEFDPYTVGEQVLYVTASGEEEDVTKELKVTVQDTAAPVITLRSDTVTVKRGTMFSPRKNIVSVADPVEGDLICLGFEEEENSKLLLNETIDDFGFYVIDIHEVNLQENGTYPVVITAVDNHGNRTVGKFMVEVADEASSIKDSQVVFQDAVKEALTDPEKIASSIQKSLESYCTSMHGTWKNGCTVDGPALSQAVYGKNYEDLPMVFDEDEFYEEEDFEEELFEEEMPEEEQTDPETEEEEDSVEEETEEDMSAESNEEKSDPESDCYEMGGVWMEDGCAWLQDSPE